LPGIGAVLRYAKEETARGAEGWEQQVWGGMAGADAILQQYEKDEESKGKEEEGKVK
jgi:hypothetical protein